MTNDILEQKYYFSKSGWTDGTTEFHDLLRSLTTSHELTVLEIGAGPENRTSSLVASRVARLDGLDIDERARSNPALNTAMIYDGKTFPIDDQAYDLVIGDYVMEHVEYPQLMLNEIARVLRPGGHFVFRTPNIYHYVSIISRFSPQSFHLAAANKARKMDEDAVDPYPTFYRFNSRRAMRTIAREAGLHEVELRMVEKEPGYLKFSALAYRGGVAYERMVNSTRALAGLRSNVFGVLAKDG